MFHVAVVCGDPGTPENGAKEGHLYFYPNKVTFTCYDGYTLQGAQEIQCDRNGVWTAPPPSCECYHLDTLA